MTRNVMRILVAAILITILVVSAVLASEELKNTDSETAVALRVEFSRAVRIEAHGREFRTQEPSGKASVFLFSNGSVRPRRTFEIEWSPSTARIVSIEWLSETDLTPPEPTLKIVPSFAYGEAPFSVSFEAVLENADSAGTRFEWDFGDGSSGIGQSVNHSFEVMGVYLVTLTANLSGNEEIVADALITVSPIHVNPETGDDSLADGSIERPYRTITNAVKHVAKGQAVLLAPGVYNTQSGEAARIEVPASVDLIGSMESADVVRVIASVVCRGSTTLAGIHFYGTVYLEEATSFITDCAFTGSGEGISRGEGLFFAASVLLVQDCDFCNYNEAIIAWAGFVTVQDCSMSGSLFGVAANTESEVTIAGSEIRDCHHGVVALHGGLVYVKDTVLTENTIAVCLLGDSGSRASVEGCHITGNGTGIALKNPCTVDLGGGIFGSVGGNSFENNSEFNIRDLRPPFSGPLYAVGNEWGTYSSETREIVGPALHYNQEKCYIENEGNSIIFSD
jgi:PKD repeat protein